MTYSTKTFVFTLFWCFLLSFISRSQNSFTFSGNIINPEYPDSVVAIVKINPGNISIKSDLSGFFYTSLKEGSYQVEIKSFGYYPIRKTIQIQSNTNEEFELRKQINSLKEVVIKKKNTNDIKNPKLGQIEISMNDVKTLPSFMGEADILKVIQLLPGVSSVSEGGQGFYVRGGSPDQNLVLYDDVPIYNASHLFGFFSIFNSDAVKSANLIKGSMPAYYGGRMSSVLEITANEGNNDKLKMNGGIGLISSRLEIETPFHKKKGSLMIAGRRTYIDVLTKPFIPKTSEFYGSSYFFYDFNVKANYKLTNKQNIQFVLYNGIDKFQYVNTTDEFNVQIPWGNFLTSFKWNYKINEKTQLNTTSYYTKYNFSFGSEQTDFSVKLTSGIYDIGQKINLTYRPNEKHTVRTGVDYTFHKFTPSSISARQGETEFTPGNNPQLFSHETALYVSDDYFIKPNLKLYAGLRYSMFQFVGPFDRFVKDGLDNTIDTITYKRNEKIKFYGGFEPRISLSYEFKNKAIIRAGYTYHYQYIHLTSLSSLSLPTDIWFPTTDIAKPQKGSQTTIGLFKNWFDDKLETSVELYYKSIQNLIEYKPGALPSDNISDNVDNVLVFGSGISKGIEFFIKKTTGKWTGWLGYTLAKSDRYFPDIQKERFPSKYDRRHDFTFVSNFKISDRLTLGSVFVFATGNTMTLPSSWYIQEQTILFDYFSRNSTRMPAYQRLDLSLTLYDKPTKKKYITSAGESMEVPKRFRSNWNFSVYNVYNYANPFFIYLSGQGFALQGTFRLSLKQVTLFPIIPSITWNFSF
ncbi:MAG: TonB-dependent receptor domain-containing protein [Crocinitomicaceae bacterium]|jgi:hypothetical protein